jgi:hypothetical protein
MAATAPKKLAYLTHQVVSKLKTKKPKYEEKKTNFLDFKVSMETQTSSIKSKGTQAINIKGVNPLAGHAILISTPLNAGSKKTIRSLMTPLIIEVKINKYQASAS